MSVTPRGMSVQEAYREYRAGNFRVNRRYQRKLVWTREEQAALIDSILCGYPIPLILLAFHTDASGKKSFEILDGMQRLNAIFKFVENDFEVEGKFFDVQHLSRAKQLADAGSFKANQDPAKFLEANRCADFADYTLAVSEFPGGDEEAVHEVFGRINSYGRRLSEQEKRQAGVVSGFADAVRSLAAEIRGDVSAESLDLSEMPAISIDVSGENQPYGVKAADSFWCKQGILRKTQLRDSEDEQLLADIAISVLEDEPFAFSGKALDEYYRPGSDDAKEVERKLAAYGATKLKTEILGTISILREVIERVNSAPNALRQIVVPGSANPVKTAFFAVFFAFFELCVRQKKSPKAAASIVEALSGLQQKLSVAAGQIRSQPRKKNIQLTTGLIQDYFDLQEPPALMHSDGAALPFENALRRSKLETGLFECKQGLHRLDNTRQRDAELLPRIVQTLCGIANCGAEIDGALFIGVADDEKDHRRIQELDGVIAPHVANRFVVGVDRELRYASLDLESYFRLVVDFIANSKLSEPLRADILSRCDCINYRGASVICLWVQPQTAASAVDDKLYIRVGSSTQEAIGAQAMGAVFRRFSDAPAD